MMRATTQDLSENGTWEKDANRNEALTTGPRGTGWGGDFDWTIHENGTAKKMQGFTDDNTSRMAATFIEQHAGSDKPFFLYLGLKAPHLPFAYPRPSGTRI